ncbi:MAG: hypothetical protein ACRDBY_07985 [Cetobacterium sp.]
MIKKSICNICSGKKYIKDTKKEIIEISKNHTKVRYKKNKCYNCDGLGVIGVDDLTYHLNYNEIKRRLELYSNDLKNNNFHLTECIYKDTEIKRENYEDDGYLYTIYKHDLNSEEIDYKKTRQVYIEKIALYERTLDELKSVQDKDFKMYHNNYKNNEKDYKMAFNLNICLNCKNCNMDFLNGVGNSDCLGCKYNYGSEDIEKSLFQPISKSSEKWYNNIR